LPLIKEYKCATQQQPGTFTKAGNKKSFHLIIDCRVIIILITCFPIPIIHIVFSDQRDDRIVSMPA